ncbi:MAG: hypothetical protein HS126_19310 [Anaerolineales bacterium]|nr:hypothetical protein [Anaerolineales bacterium]
MQTKWRYKNLNIPMTDSQFFLKIRRLAGEMDISMAEVDRLSLAEFVERREKEKKEKVLESAQLL